MNSKQTNKDSDSILYLYKTILIYTLRYPVLTILLFVGIGGGILYECIVPLIFKWVFNEVLISKDIKLLVLVAVILTSCSDCFFIFAAYNHC
jgi:uncharacterized membrane protein